VQDHDRAPTPADGDGRATTSSRPPRAAATHEDEPHGSGSGRLGWLRAGVLGANDGIVSTAGLVVGVAGATSERAPLLTAGVAGLVAGAVSMALGEYVSVSTQRDSETALLAQERRELETEPEAELAELAELYEQKGLSPATAGLVAAELTAHDAFAAHVDVELRLDPDELSRPWQAAGASALAFTTGALLPLAAILLPPPSARVSVTVVAVLLALALTGAVSARLGRSPVLPALVRLLAGGGLAMAATFAIGSLVGGAAGS